MTRKGDGFFTRRHFSYVSESLRIISAYNFGLKYFTEFIASSRIKTTSVSGFPSIAFENSISDTALTVRVSLAIEANTLTIEQVTEVLNGRVVIAPPKDIQEVKNAFEIYEQLNLLDPYNLDMMHKLRPVNCTR